MGGRSLHISLTLLLVSLFAVYAVGQSGTFHVIKTINVDINPFGATLSPLGTKVWVANADTFSTNGNKATVIDVPTLTEEPAKITVQLFPEDIAFGRLGLHAFVTNSSSSSAPLQ